MAAGMGKEPGDPHENQEIFILEDTKMIKNAGMVVMCGLMVAYMKDISETILSTILLT
jgi:hypothetical protein